MIKKILGGLAVFCIAVGLLSVTAQAEELQEGDYTYQILYDNTAEITGYTGEDTEIVIPDTIDGYSVTSIGYGAFRYCSNLTSVGIPDSIAIIGGSAFSDCSSLSNINIPEGLKRIEDDTFSACSSLKNIVIPDSVTEIGNRVFVGCSSLSDIDIPEGITSIGYFLFSGCSSLKTIIIPDSVTEISFAAFEDCSSLSNINIPERVTYIGGEAFSGCSSLMRINVSENNKEYCSVDGVLFNKSKTELVTYPSKKAGNVYKIPEGVTRIECAAFYGCESLSSVSTPDSVTSIGYSAFENCSSLSDINIPNGLISIESSTFEGCSNLSSISIPDSVTSISFYAFCGCSSLSSINIPDGLISIETSTFEGCSNLSSISIPDSVISIENSAFYGCSNLSSISIPDRVTSIGYSAFRDCSSLSNINIPNGITSINDTTFYGCSNLSSIDIPNSVTSIGEWAFGWCENMSYVNLSDSVTSIESYAFYKTNIGSIAIPKSVVSIGSCAFENCDSFTNVFYAGSEEEWNNISIEENNQELLSAAIYYGVTEAEIVDYAFRILEDGTAEITGYIGPDTEIVIPDTIVGYRVTSIGDNAFYFDNRLVSISIPDSVTKIGNNVFAMHGGDLKVIEVSEKNKSYCDVDGVLFDKNKTKLIKYPAKKVGNTYTIPEGVTDIEDDAFLYCENLNIINIPNSVTNIGWSAFAYCNSLDSIIIPEGVTNIEESAFFDCDSLSSVSISGSVTSIGDRAFAYCSNLVDIEVSKNNEKYCAVDGVLFNKDKTSLIAYPPKKAGSVYTIPEGVKLIDATAFSNCIGLKDIILPDSLTTIGWFAFDSCESLNSLNIPEGVTNIDEFAFDNCKNLSSINIPGSMTGIWWGAFAYCSSLKDVYYAGSEESWKNIEIDGNNDWLLAATIHYASGDEDISDKFQDISSEEWFYEAVNYVYKNNIMTGMNETSFAPYDTLVRAQFASVLYSANNLPDVTFEAKFSDVMEDDWYADAVIWANKNGIVNGYGSGAFGPGDAVTREQMAIMMYNYAAAQGYANNQRADISTFADAGLVSWYAEEAMQWAVGSGVITGKDKGTRLDPQGSASRAECAAIMQKFMEKFN